MSNLVKLIDIEKDLREYEGCLSAGLRHFNSARSDSYFTIMEELGFLVNNKFLPIIDIIMKAQKLTGENKVFALEAVACDLSLIAKEFLE